MLPPGALRGARGRLRGRQPKPSTKQETELLRMRDTGDYSITDLAELFRALTHQKCARSPYRCLE